MDCWQKGSVSHDQAYLNSSQSVFTIPLEYSVKNPTVYFVVSIPSSMMELSLELHELNCLVLTEVEEITMTYHGSQFSPTEILSKTLKSNPQNISSVLIFLHIILQF